MTIPFYKVADGASHPQSMHQHANVGLWFTRFFNQYESDWSIKKEIKQRGEIIEKEGKFSWISDVAKAHFDADLISSSVVRLEKLGKALGAEVANFKTDWNFATGMGLNHPVENGFTWHHTLGVPYLPASGVKGMLRGWVEEWMEHDSDDSKKRCISHWFGASASEGDLTEGAGNLIFFDALPLGLVNLGCDIMTPHMGDWYAKGGEIKSEADYAKKAPADWHSPVPVPFLVVKQAEFKFMIAPRLTGDVTIDAQSRLDAKAAMAELTLALEWIGAGAKTAAGYGRMRLVGAEQAATLAQAQAGIEKASGIVWSAAKATWDKSKQILTVQSETDKSILSGSAAKSMFDALSEAAQKRLKDGKKPLIVNATVDKFGNLFTLLGMTEAAAI
jgi:CRISPR-associated protein Cmr6